MKKQLFFALSLVMAFAFASCDSPNNGGEDTKLESLSFEKTEVTLTVGASTRLVPIVTPSGASVTYTWATSDTLVATVDKVGNVTAQSTGEATITVTAEDKSATCKVTVLPFLETVQFTTAIVWDRDTTVYGDSIYEIEASDGTPYKVKIVEAELLVCTEGLYINNSGYWDGNDQGGVITIKAPMYYQPGWLSANGKGTQFCLGPWSIGETGKLKQCAGATFDEQAYFTAWENMFLSGFTADGFKAAGAAFSGPVIDSWEYSTDASGNGGYSYSYIPAAYVTKGEIVCGAHPSLDYMMNLTYSSFDATMLKGWEDFGLKTTTEAGTDNIQIDEAGTSYIIYPFQMDTKAYHYEQGTKSAAAPRLVPTPAFAVMQDMPIVANSLKAQMKDLNTLKRK